MAALDQTLAVALRGYAWLPDLRRRAGGRPVHTRVLGRRAVGLCGPAATEFFYADGHLERYGALPHPVVATLSGRGAVHTLDGAAHAARKEIFVSLLSGDRVDELAKLAGEAFDTAADGWRGAGPVSLFGGSATAIARAVTRWAGVPVADADVPALARDLVAMVDGFATLGPRHARALAARRRRERWLAGLVAGVRTGAAVAGDSALAALAAAPLPARTAAVELLNVIRPATAVAWFVAFTGHALDLAPGLRTALRGGDDAYVRAFVHEVRRFYPFAPFLGARATRDLAFDGTPIPAGTLVLLDVYGQNHDPVLWPQPYTFRPERFLEREPGPYDLIPQGGGDPRTGHRCPGEQVTVALLGTLARRLARVDYYLPPQDLGIDLARVPARPASGVQLVAY